MFHDHIFVLKHKTNSELFEIKTVLDHLSYVIDFAFGIKESTWIGLREVGTGNPALDPRT